MKGLNPPNWLRRSSPTILICIGAVGVVVTAILAAKGGTKVKKLIEEAENEKINEELTPIETVKAVAPAYIPATISGVLTITCILSANALSRKTQASLMSAYVLLENYFKQYRGQTKKLFGKDADKKIIKSIPLTKAKPSPIFTHDVGMCSTLDFGVSDEVERRFYDSFSGVPFSSTIEKVIQAEYHLNRNFYTGAPAIKLNEFYSFLGLPPVEGGDYIGWCLDDGIEWVDFKHSITELDDGMQYCIIDFVVTPRSLPTYYV